MELQGEDGSVIELSEALQKELGRGPGVAPHDRTVSRRQVRLQLSKSRFRVAVEVIGANPICLIYSNGQVHIAKSGTHSSLEAGDKLSLSIQDPSFYTLQAPVARGGVDRDEEEGIAEAVARWQRRKQDRLQKEGDKTLNPKHEEQKEQAEGIISEPEPVSRQPDLELEDDIDFVKKFGFVVEGSEFERYGKKAHDTSMWEWQIGPLPANDSDEEDEQTGKISTSGSKANQIKPRRGDDDDDWQGDSEGETKELLSTGKRRKKEVHTRSHDLATSSTQPKPVSTSAISKTGITSSKRKSRAEEEEEEEEDDDDDGEDLDGFLVDDVEEEDEPEAADDEDELTDEDEDEEVEEEEEEIDGEGDEKPLCKFGNKCFRKSKDHLAQFRH